jgi:transposase
MEFIDGILIADERAPKKQRHTARRIWQRIGQERPQASVGEATVRGYVRRRKQELGQVRRETFIPQVYDWGVEAQVDWYEAMAEIGGEMRKVYGFSMRSMASGGAFHVAYYHATQQAFLEGHVRAFAYFEGVPRRILYDNTKIAVAKILGGEERKKTKAFSELQSHYLFADKFGRPAKGHEKDQASYCTSLDRFDAS